MPRLERWPWRWVVLSNSCCIHSCRIRSKGTLRIMYLKYPGLDMIQGIHHRCGSIISFGSIIRFGVLVKKRNIRFRIKNLVLDFSKKNAPQNLKIMRPEYYSHSAFEAMLYLEENKLTTEFKSIAHLHDDVILLLRPESFRILLSCAN